MRSNSLKEIRVSPQRGLPTTFRELGQDFCEQVVDLEPRCYPAPWSAELIRNEFRKDTSLRFGLLQEDMLIAYCFNYLVLDELHVLNLAVAPEHRARGLGKALLLRVMLEAYKRGARSATLEVRQSNKVAKQLYANLGFEILGMRKNYYRDNQEHALVLQCRMDRFFVPEGRSIRVSLESSGVGGF